MKPAVLAVAALGLLGFTGAVGYKAFRYRQEARRWHDRWSRLHANPANFERYRADNARIQRGDGIVEGRVVFLGASITESLDLRTPFPQREFLNRGTGGQLVWQQYLRLGPDALDLNPEAVVLKMCAINLLPDAPSLDETRYYFTLMAEAVRRRGMKVIVATTVPVSRAWDRDEAGGTATAKIREFNDWARNYAREHHDMVIDYASVLSDEQGYLIDTFSEDGLHPNEGGKRRMLELIRSVLIQGRMPVADTPPSQNPGAQPPAPGTSNTPPPAPEGGSTNGGAGR
ncbi:MAG: hypothetical protein JNK72_20830 [Myxococcales bacterium]|nr:hypothetical protein [Myxococcales bacterium]